MSKKVLNVGCCAFDHGTIEKLISANFNATVLTASLQEEALEMLRDGQFDLVLINRKLDRDSSDGVELIGRIRRDPQLADTPVMLISNFPEAQQDAIGAGAEPGFGKAQLDHPETLEKLGAVLGK